MNIEQQHQRQADAVDAEDVAAVDDVDPRLVDEVLQPPAWS